MFSAQLTPLFSNDVLTRVERMRLQPNRRLTNRSRGEHAAGRGGASIEFADYRNYVEGDDLRYVDWNIFARLNRPYLKQYRHEEELHVVLIVDASTSMRSEEKLDRARQLAAAFGVMGLMSQERVSVYGCHVAGENPQIVAPCAGRVQVRRLLASIAGCNAGGDLTIDDAVELVLRLHRGKGIAVVLSDFLTFGDLTRPFNQLYRAGLEVWGLQLLGPSELDPPITGDVRLVDSETGDLLDVSSAADLLGFYREHRLALEAEIAQLCRQRGGRFAALNSSTPLEAVLFDDLSRRGWIA